MLPLTPPPIVQTAPPVVIAPASDWSTSDTWREAAVTVVSAMDWGQTLTIANRPTRYRELNPLLGPHPSRAKVNLYFAASIALHVLIARMLPPKWRHAFQYVSLGWESSIVEHNSYYAGIKVMW